MRKRCERARRDEGLQARLNCDICGRGPCSRKAPDVAVMPYSDGYALWNVPNRLYGATINHEGEAV